MAAQPTQTDSEQLRSAVQLPLQSGQKRQPTAPQRAMNGSYSVDTHSPKTISAKTITEQNPELLHWRANVLLDEMMLGAIDLAASDSVPARALSPRQGNGYASADRADGPSREVNSATSGRQMNSARATQPDYESTGSERAGVGSLSVTNRLSPNHEPIPSATDHAALFDDTRDYDYRPTHARQTSAISPDGAPTGIGQQGDARQWQPSRSEQPSSTQPRQDPSARAPLQKGASHAASAPPLREGERPQAANGTEQWLFAAEQRYEQLAARRQASQDATTGAGYEYDGWSMVAEPTATPDYRVAAAPYGLGNDQEQIPSYGRATTGTPSATGLTPSASRSGAGVSNGLLPTSSRKSLRSNLLPRMNTLDSRTVQQEMGMLQNAIEGALPVGHESRTRAQHLLQKAHTLVQTDPTRSAEVDYYLQQVRTIMQRAQETVHWSNLYQNRLRTYLLAWLALSLIVILSRYLYAIPLSQWLARLSGQSNSSLWVYNVLTIMSAFFFGALGGGLGALSTMIQHTRLGQGFFDRKYGLRGLILPLIGALFGLGLCILFGVLYAILGIDPASNLWFGLLPALLALAAGASQDYLYGTHES